MAASSSISSTTALVIVDTRLYDADPARALSLLRQFHGLCANEFDPNELEDLPDWEARLVPEPRIAMDKMEQHQLTQDFFGVFALLTAKIGGRVAEADQAEVDGEQIKAPVLEVVVAGIALELYPKQRIGLLAYVVVASSFRGKGLSRELVDVCRQWVAKRFAASLGEDSSADLTTPTLIIEVLQVRDVLHHGGDDGDDNGETEEDGKDKMLSEKEKQEKVAAAASRQVVWAKMGFVPLRGVNLVHPGRLAGGRYNIAVLPCASSTSHDQKQQTQDAKAAIGLSRFQLKSWLDLFFRLIIEDSRDEADDDDEGEEDKEGGTTDTGSRRCFETEQEEALRLVTALNLPQQDFIAAENDAWL